MTDLEVTVPLYHSASCSCALCKAAGAALAEIELLEASVRAKDHTIMCLKAEVTARNGANLELREQRDILEEGLREAKAEITKLKHAIEFRRKAENRSLTD